VISVASNKFTDASNNTNNDGSDSNNTFTLSVDTRRPTIAISSDVTSLKAGETATITFTLSESSSDFVASDVTASGGALSSFLNTGSGTTYTATFKPTADSTTNGVISVASRKFSNAAGNRNYGSDFTNTVILSVDTSIPLTPTPTPEPEPEDYELPLTINTIKGSKKDDDLIGTKQNDFIDGKKGDDVLTGSKGNDLLKGKKGDDFLFGDNGKDYLDGSKGTDSLTGGKGADVFQISKGINRAEDFSIKQGDRIALTKKGKYTIIDQPDFDSVLVQASPNHQLYLQRVDYDDVIAAGVDLFVQPI
jgi:Ca2+-binding RTX toxin-like protein